MLWQTLDVTDLFWVVEMFGVSEIFFSTAARAIGVEFVHIVGILVDFQDSIFGEKLLGFFDNELDGNV